MDREKVIKGLRCIKGDLILCVDCAYSDGNGHGTYSCKAFCANDALALLKEQAEEIDGQIKGRRMTDAESTGMLFDDPLDLP